VLFRSASTSTKLVEALVDDLGEGGFSGAVEITLRDTDGYVIIDRGKLSAAIERREGGDWSPTTVAELASRSQRERGRISVYEFSEGVAPAIANRFTAQPLYTQLSTDFADLEKMILKLSRERDRQWFIEVVTAGSKTSLIHLLDDRCRVVTEKATASLPENDSLDPAKNSALRELLDQINHEGGVFDVYFARPDATADLIAEKTPEPVPVATDAAMDAASDSSSVASTAEPDETIDAPVQTPASDIAEAATGPALPRVARQTTGALNDAEAMAEIKRLMGEMARTIEVSTQAIEQRDSFSMYLRTGQLKIADRYPFLDPFGAEFEYLGGEIAFVGQAKPEEFIAGLTEALRLALTGVAESSVQTARLRARVSEDLRGFLDRNRADLERYGLDQSVEQIIG